MRNKRKYMLAVVGASAVLLLQACGGGGDDGGGGGGSGGGSGGNTAPTNTTPDTTPGGNTGIYSAPFEAGAVARYLLVASNGLKSGPLDTHEQVDGAIVTINDNQLSGDDRAVLDVSGDATFALGSWGKGTVTTAQGAYTLTGSDGRDYHYVLYNGLQALPTSGSFACDAGTFTIPARISGTGPMQGSVSGEAQLAFDSGGAIVEGDIEVRASTFDGDNDLDTRISNPNAISFTDGANVKLADAGNGAYAVVGSYQVTAGDSVYLGTYRFLCK